VLKFLEPKNYSQQDILNNILLISKLFWFNPYSSKCACQKFTLGSLAFTHNHAQWHL